MLKKKKNQSKRILISDFLLLPRQIKDFSVCESVCWVIRVTTLRQKYAEGHPSRLCDYIPPD